MNSSFALDRLAAGVVVFVCGTCIASAQDGPASTYADYASSQGATFPVHTAQPGAPSGPQGGPDQAEGAFAPPPAHAQLSQQAPIPVQIPSYESPAEGAYGQMPGGYQRQDLGFDQLAEGWVQPSGQSYGSPAGDWGQPMNPLYGDDYGYHGSVPYQALPGPSGGYYGVDNAWQPRAQVVAPPHYYVIPAPEPDYHRQMLERLDTIAATLGRIEKLLRDRN